MTAKNEFTGDLLKSKPNSQEYESNYDRIFGDSKPNGGSFKQDKETGEFIPAWQWEVKYGEKRNPSPFIIGNMTPYQSPIDGRWINSREQRKEDLKRSGSRPYEGLEVEKREAQRIQEEKQKAFEAKIPGMIEKTAIQLRDGMTKPCRDPISFD